METRKDETRLGAITTMAGVCSAVLAAGLFIVPDLHAQEQRDNPKQQQMQRAEQEPRQRAGQARNGRQQHEAGMEDYLVIRLAEYSNLIPAVQVQVQNRTATLAGRVPSEEAKQWALRVARGTRGIESVRDQLKIDSSMADTYSNLARNIDEKQLAQQVARRIAGAVEGAKSGEDWWFTGWRVEGPYNRWNLVVEVEEPDSIVLEGEVPDLSTMRKAVEAAAKVPGVRGVDTDLELQGFAYPYARESRPYAYAWRAPYYGLEGEPYAYGWRPYYPPYGFAPQAWYPSPEDAMRQKSRESRSAREQTSAR